MMNDNECIRDEDFALTISVLDQYLSMLIKKEKVWLLAESSFVVIADINTAFGKGSCVKCGISTLINKNSPISVR